MQSTTCEVLTSTSQIVLVDRAGWSGNGGNGGNSTGGGTGGFGPPPL